MLKRKNRRRKGKRNIKGKEGGREGGKEYDYKGERRRNIKKNEEGIEKRRWNMKGEGRMEGSKREKYELEKDEKCKK